MRNVKAHRHLAKPNPQFAPRQHCRGDRFDFIRFCRYLDAGGKGLN
jgi:hypothetical protein